MNTMAPLFAPLRPDDVNRAAYLRIEDRLRPFFEARVLSSTDVHVAAHLCRRTGQLDPDVALALALAVRAPSRAHICVNLETLYVELRDVEDDDDEEAQDALASALCRTTAKLVSKLNTVALVAGPQSQDKRPFVLDGSWLYVHRFCFGIVI